MNAPKRTMLAYPTLLAVFPVLHIAAGNLGEYTVRDLLVVLASAVCVFGLIQLTLTLLFRRDPHFVAVATTLLIAVVFLFQFAMRLVRRYVSWRGGSPPYSLILTAIGTGVLLWLLYRWRGKLAPSSRFLTVLATILVVWSGSLALSRHKRAVSAIEGSALAASFARPIPATASAATAAPPDIYMIIMDEYANADVLAEFFAFDNRPFEDSLRQLGFTVPDVVRSNYAMTLLSLPSLLNFDYVTGLTGELGRETRASVLPRQLIEGNRTSRFLKQRGYRFLFFPNPWWPATLHNRHADLNYGPPEEGLLRTAARRTQLRRAIWYATFLPLLFQGPGSDASHIEASLEALADVARDSSGTFALAHFMAPHPPYNFTKSCSHRSDGLARTGHGSEQDRAEYTNQVHCMNKLLLRTVRRILRESDVPPIVLLQSDHGSASQNPVGQPLDRAQPSYFRERFGAFGAYHLPGGPAHALGDTVTAVNVLRHVLRHYFGADLPPLPDRYFFSVLSQPYDLIEIEPAALLPPHEP